MSATRAPAQGLVALLAGLAMLGPFSIDAMFPGFPAIGGEFAVSAPALQQLLSLYLLSYTVMALLHGPLSDALGRRRVILAGTLLYALSGFGCALADSFGALLAFRVLMGAVAGAGIIVGRAVVRDVFEGARAERAMAVIGLIFGLGPALAPVLGGLLLAGFGWRAIFLALALLGLVLAVLVWRLLPETHPPERRQPLALAALLAGYRGLLADPAFLLLAFATTFNFAALFLYIASAPAVVLDRLRLGILGFPGLFVPMVAGLMAGAGLAARLAGRVPGARVVAGAYAAMALAQVGNLALALGPAPGWPIAVLPLLPLAAGIAAAFPVITVAMLDRAPGRRGTASSLQTALSLGFMAAVAGLLAPLLFHDLSALALGSAPLTLAGYAAWRGGTLAAARTPPRAGD